MTSHQRNCRSSIAFLLLVLLPGCYSYTPLETGEPRVGQDVQVHLAEPGGSDSPSPAPATGGRTLSGLVVSSRADSLTLSMSGGGAWNSQVGSAALRDTLTLARSSIRQIDLNRVDPVRTTIMAGLGAAAVTAAVILVANSSPDNSSGSGGPGGTPRNSVTIPVRIPLSFP